MTSLEDYLRAIASKKLTDLNPYLQEICPECGELGVSSKGIHTLRDKYVVVGCEGYWVVSPNILGLPMGNWCEQEKEEQVKIENIQPEPDEGITHAIEEAGFEWSWEYPGILCVKIAEGMWVFTGLHGYGYGDVGEEMGDAVTSVQPGLDPDLDATPEEWVRCLETLRDGARFHEDQAKRKGHSHKITVAVSAVVYDPSPAVDVTAALLELTVREALAKHCPNHEFAIESTTTHSPVV